MQQTLEDHIKETQAFISKGGNIAALADIPPFTLDQMYLNAVNLYEKNKYMEALKKFRTLCFFDHWNPKYFIGLGSCQKMLKLYGNAIDSFSYAVRLDLLNPLPLVYMGDCYSHLNQPEKAQHSYQAAVVFSKEFGIEHKEFSKAESLITQQSEKGN